MLCKLQLQLLLLAAPTKAASIAHADAVEGGAVVIEVVMAHICHLDIACRAMT